MNNISRSYSVNRRRLLTMGLAFLGAFFLTQGQPFTLLASGDSVGERVYTSQQFDVAASTELSVLLPLDSVTQFEVQNGITRLTGNDFSMFVESQTVRFEFVEGQLLASLTLPETTASTLFVKTISLTNRAGQPVDHVRTGDAVVVNNVRAVNRFATPGLQLTGTFSVSVSDPQTGALLDLLQAGTHLSGRIVVKPLSVKAL